MTTQEVKRKLTAILSADVKGYSRLMGEDEEGTLRTLTAYREAMATLIQQYRGRVVNAPGDSLLAEFESVVELSYGEQERMMAKGTNNLEAYSKMLEAWEYRQTFNKESQALSRQLAEETVAMDPEYALAYSCVAAAIGNEVFLGVYKNPKEAFERAMEFAQKAVEIDESLAFPHVILGFISLMLKRDYEKGIAEAERAVALEPNSADAYTQLGVHLSWAGRHEEAITYFNKAVRLSPIPPSRCLLHMAHSYRFIGQYEQAIAIYEKMLQQNPNQLLARTGLAAAYMLSGREEEALAQAAEVLRMDPKFSSERFGKTLPYKNQADIDRFIDALRKAGLK